LTSPRHGFTLPADPFETEQRHRAKLAVAFDVPTRERLGIAFAKENAALCEAVNRALAALHANGELAQLEARWFLPHS
jgi:ABC-type amino acid transport substrate-binding protein